MSLLLPPLLLLCVSLCGQGATISITPGGTAFQDALDIVQPGDVISVGEGEYWESIRTRTDGTADKPIVIQGAGDRENTVLRGEMPASGLGLSNRVFQVMHDYYIIEDFTVDGDASGDPDIDSEASYKELYRDMLIYVTAGRSPTRRAGGYVSALDGLIIRNMRIRNGGGECIRLRDFVTYADIHNNEIEYCGVYDYRFDGGGENGEGVYIGTSSNQWDDGKNWDDGPDVCLGNVVRENTIRTTGNEGIDVKEGSVDTVIKGNNISMQRDADSGGINSRGDRSIISYNYIEDAHGAGVRLGGHEVDDIKYGVDNQVFGNTIENCRAFGVKIQVAPQGQICGNVIEPPSSEDNEDDYKYTGGDYNEDEDYDGPAYDARAPCAEPERTCSDNIEGIDGHGAICCPLGCGQCGGSGCSRYGAASGLGSESCCERGVKASGKYCDDTGTAPCIYGSSPLLVESTCSDGIEGIDGHGAICCPLGCGQCGGSGCSKNGAASGLGSESCCGGGVRASARYCDDTGTAPCIYGSPPSTGDNTCSNGIEGIDGGGVVCCPLGCGQCGGSGCGKYGAANDLGPESCCSGGVMASGVLCAVSGKAPCII